MTRINRTDTLFTELRDIKRRLRLLEAARMRSGTAALTATSPGPSPSLLPGASAAPTPQAPTPEASASEAAATAAPASDATASAAPASGATASAAPASEAAASAAPASEATGVAAPASDAAASAAPASEVTGAGAPASEAAAPASEAPWPAASAIPVPLMPARPAEWAGTTLPDWERLAVTWAVLGDRGARITLHLAADSGTVGAARIIVDGEQVADVQPISQAPTRQTIELPASQATSDTGEPVTAEIVVEARRTRGDGLVRVAALLLPA